MPHSGVVGWFEPTFGIGKQFVLFFLDEPLMTVILRDVVVMQMMLTMTPGPWDEVGETNRRMYNFSYDAVDGFGFGDCGVPSVMSNAPLPHNI